jgi:APA family basic amino acid/polyamine antiporter
MLSLPAANWYRLFGWLAVGLVVYFTYSRRHSVLRKLHASGALDDQRPPIA